MTFLVNFQHSLASEKQAPKLSDSIRYFIRVFYGLFGYSLDIAVISRKQAGFIGQIWSEIHEEVNKGTGLYIVDILPNALSCHPSFAR